MAKKKSIDGKTRVPVVMVEWKDAVHDFDSSAGKEVPRMPMVRTVGFLIANTSECVCVAMEYIGDGEYRNKTAIPRELVKGNLTILDEVEL